MGLVGLAEGVEAGIGNLLHPRANLFGAEGMALAEQVLVLAGAVDEGGLAVEHELAPPLNASDAERCAHLVGGLAATLNHCGQVVEIGIVGAPQLRVLNPLGMSQYRRSACGQHRSLGVTEHLLAAGQGELVDQLDGLRFRRVVPDLGLYKHGVALGVVPHVYAERLYAHFICLNEADGTEQAERLATLAEAPLGGTAATDPRRLGLHGGMVDVNAQRIVATEQRVGHVERQHGAPHQFAGEGGGVEGDGGVGAHTLQLEKIATAGLLLRGERLLVDSRAMQVTVTQLAIAVVVVEVVWQVDGRSDRVATCKAACLPTIVEQGDGAAA